MDGCARRLSCRVARCTLDAPMRRIQQEHLGASGVMWSRSFSLMPPADSRHGTIAHKWLTMMPFVWQPEGCLRARSGKSAGMLVNCKRRSVQLKKRLTCMRSRVLGGEVVQWRRSQRGCWAQEPVKHTFHVRVMLAMRFGHVPALSRLSLEDALLVTALASSCSIVNAVGRHG